MVDKVPKKSNRKSDDVDASKKIQTAWRLKKKHPKNRDTIAQYANHIIQPVVTVKPEALSQLNQGRITSKRNEILSNIPENLRKYYHLVSHDTFIMHLKKSFSLALEDIQNEPYTFIYSSNMPGEEEKRKSEHWVVGELLKEDYRFQPYPPPEQDPSLSYLRNKPEVKNILIFDDASYSGDQISSFIDYYMRKDKNLTDCTVHFIIPFISKNAKNKINELILTDFPIKVKLHCSGKIWHINERLKEMTGEEKKACSQSNIKYLTLFSHKQADELSLGHGAKKRAGSIALYKFPGTREDYKDYWEREKNKK